ncbi:MAG: hypothetical protein MJ145_03740 [Clostridia bacterium]|nr:hypothetical protein [Clostridia bacterium]
MNIWEDLSIGEIMKNEKYQDAILKCVKGDLFLEQYFKTFAKTAKHSFAEIEEGSQSGQAISAETLERIKKKLKEVQDA